MLFPRWNFATEGGRFFSGTVEIQSTKRKLSSSWATNHASFPKLGLLEVMCSISKSRQLTKLQPLQQDFQYFITLAGDSVFIFPITLSHSAKASQE